MKHNEARKITEELKKFDCFLDRILDDTVNGWVVIIQGRQSEI